MSLQALMLRFRLGMNDLLGLLSSISGRKLTLALEVCGEGSPLGSISYVQYPPPSLELRRLPARLSV